MEGLETDHRSTGPVEVMQNIDGLTGIRGLAVTMVFLFHLFALSGNGPLIVAAGELKIPYHWLFTCGWMGANVFFVLSGFLLAVPFVRQLTGCGKPVQIAPYLIHRLCRVVPAYWMQIVIFLVVIYLTGTLPGWKVVAAHLAFLQNFRVGYVGVINGVYWTLPAEVGFYLLLPLFAAVAGHFANRRAQVWLITVLSLTVFAIGYRYAMYSSVATAPVSTKAFVLLQLPGMLDQFAAGMAVAWIYVNYGKSFDANKSTMMFSLGLAGLIGMMISIDYFAAIFWDAHVLLFVGYTIIAGFIGLVVLGTALQCTLSKRLFANAPMMYLGLVSYSLYLWHFPILNWATKLLDHTGVVDNRLWWLVIIALPVSLIAATASYYFVERPFLQRKRVIDVK
jgi:peptidoglycan/LPS O-acetylase OafA/YrhL